MIDVATGSVVRDSKQGSVCGLTTGRPDPRPRVDQLVVLRPGIAVSREIELDGLWHGLKNGRYLIRLKPKGCWWHFEDVKSEPDHEGRVSMRCRTAKQTPVVLESGDTLEIDVIEGSIVMLQDDGR